MDRLTDGLPKLTGPVNPVGVGESNEATVSGWG